MFAERMYEFKNFLIIMDRKIINFWDIQNEKK